MESVVVTPKPTLVNVHKAQESGLNVIEAGAVVAWSDALEPGGLG
jgi:hypothetical protein